MPGSDYVFSKYTPPFFWGFEMFGAYVNDEIFVI